MRWWFRVILLIGATLCWAFVAMNGFAFSDAVEPESNSFLFWGVVGAVVASPLWVPAAIPSRHPSALMACRWLSAFFLLFPTLMFGSIVVSQVNRELSGLGASARGLTQGAVLTVTCLVCLVILLWPERDEQ